MLIVGHNCPDNKSLRFSLQHVFGVNTNTALKVCAMVGVHHNVLLGKLIKAGRADILSGLCRDHFSVMAQPRVKQNIQQYITIKHYKGTRHMFGLPTRGQRTRTNASTSRRLMSKGNSKKLMSKGNSKKRAFRPQDQRQKRARTR